MIKTLSNGIRIVAEHLPQFSSVSVGIWVKTGSTSETPHENGLSHFIEHMMFKGTQQRSARQIAAEIDRIGGQINAFTAKECTCYYSRVVPDKLGVALDVLADLFTHSVHDPAEMEKEKGVVLEEIAMVNDNVEELAHEKISELFYTGSALSQPILGNPENIRAFAQSDIFSYIDRHYHPANVVVAVAGRYDEAELMELVEQHFGGYGRGQSTRADETADVFVPQPRRLFVEKDVEQTHLCLGFPAPTLADDERFSLAVLNNIFGGGMSSRLFQTIREEKGLAYAVYSYPSFHTAAGMFCLYAGAAAANAPAVTALMRSEIDQLKAQGIGGEDFAHGKDQMIGNYLLSMDSTNARMSAIGKSLLLLGEVYDEQTTLGKIEAVSPERVNAVIGQVFDFDAMSAVFAGNLAQQKALAGALDEMTGESNG